MGDIGKYFDRKEFVCGDGCGYNYVHPELVTILDIIREYIKAPVYISSGSRCAKHNAKVGGVGGSGHLKGKAADLVVSGYSNSKLGNIVKQLYNSNKTMKQLLAYCYLITGINRVAVHVGVDREVVRKNVFGF